LDQQHAAALEDELKSKSDEASELKHQLRELAKKAPLTEPDVKKMLGAIISMLDARTPPADMWLVVLIRIPAVKLRLCQQMKVYLVLTRKPGRLNPFVYTVHKVVK
jgi:septal ring factor EnvC (AmiA/AmiB activator)